MGVQIAIQENTKNRRRREHWIRTDVDVRLNGWLVSLHVSYPLYYCTVRLQAGQVPLLPNGKLPRVDQLIVNTVRTCGWRDLFRGYLPSSLKLMPQAGFSFLTYELVQEQLEKRSKALSRKMNYDDNEEEKNDVVVFADVAEKNDSKKKN